MILSFTAISVFPQLTGVACLQEKFLERKFLSIIEENNFQQKIDFNTPASGILHLILVSDNIECVNLKQMTSNECQITKMRNHYPIYLCFLAIGQNNIKRC